ncbi:hypothetical protein CVT24_007502 [Panaeolus cyanescens]|uniref:Uncharacterized protein n=1 Tax=Panaeolus cyanescens TaxID=181874 RepID=A0A409WR95_9AGAR|nr:hypothetical protein CVT24_007502 [Panaeolus cyanescens]
MLINIITLLTLLSSTLAQDGLNYDPYLLYRPPFVRSLPIQIMLTGIVLTLVAVLFIHLMFTAQYHWPLAPVNYVLQLSGVTTLLISLIATIHVVLSASQAESEKWPYMLSYIAVNVPPSDLDMNSDAPGARENWTVAEKATWLVMNASTSGLIQITHIQFLTLLYPSKLEGRLIFALLGPLAVVAAVMQLLPISGSESVANVASAVRNVCNATLSLLFTIALFIWGLFVNRAQAWRTDGGTAVFGCAALSLAVVSTALNFLSVHKEEEYVWLPSLMWAVVLWQSFLGWWWWVGAGSGGGYGSGSSSRSREGVYDDDDEEEEDEDEEEERVRRQAKRDQRRRERSERARERGIRARRVWEGVAGAFSQSGGSSAAGASATGASVIVDDPTPRRRRRRSDVDDESVHSRRSSTTLTISRGTFGRRTTEDESSGGSVTTSSLPRFLPGFVRWWYAALRREHNRAARIQAAERVERIREMEGGRDVVEEPQVVGGAGGGVDVQKQIQPGEVMGGWYTFGWKKRRADDVGLARGVNHKGKGKERRTTRRRKEASESEVDGESEIERERNRDRQRRRRRREEQEEAFEMQDYRSSTPGPSNSRQRSSEDDMYTSYSGSEPEVVQRPSQSRDRHRDRRRREREEEEEDVERGETAEGGGRSLWWWGPLSKWRLQDSTTY